MLHEVKPHTPELSFGVRLTDGAPVVELMTRQARAYAPRYLRLIPSACRES